MNSDTIKKGVLRAPQRALLRSLGLTDREMNQPFIGVINSYNEVIPGHTGLARVAQAVKDGVRMAGGTPFECSTIGVCDGLAMGHAGMRYSLPSRDHIADSVEIVALSHAFDGLVLIPNCDKIVPGMLMAAARLPIPSILVSGGPMLGGHLDGQRVSINTVDEAVGQVAIGKMTEAELERIVNAAMPTCGACQGMFTANTMNCLTEVLGLALPGNGTIPAVYADRLALARETGMKIMDLVRRNVCPRDILSPEAFENAMAVDVALGGSTNTVLHLPAIAVSAGISFDLDSIDRISQRTPTLCRMNPAVGGYLLEDLHRAGGIPGLVKRLLEGHLLDGRAPTVTGYSLAENAAEARISDPDVIRPLDRSHSPTGGLAMLRGNLAPLGAVVKKACVAPELLVHCGPARVFDREEAAIGALLEGEIQAGDVIVVRYEGPRGGPGMREMLTLTSILCGMELDNRVALVTDGRFSGASRGAAIGHVTPEAAARGPLAVVRDGDTINIDIPNQTLSVDLSPAGIQERLARLPRWAPQSASGLLRRYARSVGSTTQGCGLSD